MSPFRSGGRCELPICDVLEETLLSATAQVRFIPVHSLGGSSHRGPDCPIPASLSQTSRRGTAPSCSASSDHIPANRSPVVRAGSMIAVMNRANEATITNTGGDPC